MDQCTHWQTRGEDTLRCGLAAQHEGVHEYVVSGRCQAVSGGLLKTRCGLPEGHPEGQQYHCPDPNNPNAGWWSMTPDQCEETIVDGDILYRCSDDKGHDGRHHIAETGLTWQDPTQQCDSTYEYPIGTVSQCERKAGHTGHHSCVGAVWGNPRPAYAEQTPAQREETDQSVRDFLGSASEPDAITALTLNFQMLSERLDRVLLGEAGERRAMQEGFEQQISARASVSALGRTRTRLLQVARQFAELDERLTQLELQTGKSEMRVYGVDVSEWDQRWLMFEKTMAVVLERLSPPTVVNANGDVVVTEQECDHPNGFGVNGCPCGAPDPDASGLAVDMDTVTDAGGHWKS